MIRSHRIDRRDRLESEARVVGGPDLREQQGQIRAVGGRLLEQPFDQIARMAMTAMRRLGEDRAETHDADRFAIERRVERVPFGARQDDPRAAGADQRQPAQVIPTPGGRELSRVVPAICGSAQALMPDGVGAVQNLLEDRPVSGDKYLPCEPPIVWQFFKPKPP